MRNVYAIIYQKSISDDIKTSMYYDMRNQVRREENYTITENKVWLSHRKAEQKQAIAIAYDTARKSKRK